MKFITSLIALLAALNLSPLTAKIVDMNRQTDTVTIETASGILYAFTGCEDYEIGDYVSAIIWRNDPRTAEDDVIVSVHYSGYSDYSADPLN